MKQVNNDIWQRRRPQKFGFDSAANTSSARVDLARITAHNAQLNPTIDGTIWCWTQMTGYHPQRDITWLVQSITGHLATPSANWIVSWGPMCHIYSNTLDGDDCVERFVWQNSHISHILQLRSCRLWLSPTNDLERMLTSELDEFGDFACCTNSIVRFQNTL